MNDTEFKLSLEKYLCDLAEIFLERYNPCLKQGDSCIVKNPNPCCSNTRFGKDGCPHWKGQCTYRNIWCKYWLCETAIKNTSSECVEVLKHIQEIGKIYNLIGKPFLGSPDYIGADKPNGK